MHDDVAKGGFRRHEEGFTATIGSMKLLFRRCHGVSRSVGRRLEGFHLHGQRLSNSAPHPLMPRRAPEKSRFAGCTPGPLSPMRRHHHDDASMPQVKLFFRCSLRITVISASQKKTSVNVLQRTRIRDAVVLLLEGLDWEGGAQALHRCANADFSFRHMALVDHAIPLPRVFVGANMTLAALSPEHGVRSRRFAHQRVSLWGRGRTMSWSGQLSPVRRPEGCGSFPWSWVCIVPSSCAYHRTADGGWCQPPAAVRGLGRSPARLAQGSIAR